MGLDREEGEVKTCEGSEQGVRPLPNWELNWKFDHKYWNQKLKEDY